MGWITQQLPRAGKKIQTSLANKCQPHVLAEALPTRMPYGTLHATADKNEKLKNL